MQASDERLYMSIEHGRRKVRSIKDVYEDTKIRVACHMAYQQSKWIQAAWEKEIMKDGKSLNRNVTETLVVYGIYAVFDKNGIHHEEEYGEMRCMTK